MIQFDKSILPTEDDFSQYALQVRVARTLLDDITAELAFARGTDKEDACREKWDVARKTWEELSGVKTAKEAAKVHALESSKVDAAKGASPSLSPRRSLKASRDFDN